MCLYAICSLCSYSRLYWCGVVLRCAAEVRVVSYSFDPSLSPSSFLSSSTINTLCVAWWWETPLWVWSNTTASTRCSMTPLSSSVSSLCLCSSAFQVHVYRQEFQRVCCCMNIIMGGLCSLPSFGQYAKEFAECLYELVCYLYICCVLRVFVLAYSCLHARGHRDMQICHVH